MRNSYKYPINDTDFSNKLLAFTKKYTFSSYLISNKNNKDKYKKHQLIVALGAKHILKSDQDSFQKLSNFHIQHKDWIFGFLSYDLKNEIENLSSDNRDDFIIAVRSAFLKKNYKQRFSLIGLIFFVIGSAISSKACLTIPIPVL